MAAQVDKDRAIELRKQGLTYAAIALELNCSFVWCAKNLANIEIEQKRIKRYLPKGHYVYFVLKGEEVVYIGKGSKYRYEHPTSGTSNNYELNRDHFDGVLLQTHILYEGMTEDQAEDLESCEIARIKPAYNTLGV